MSGSSERIDEYSGLNLQNKPFLIPAVLLNESFDLPIDIENPNDALDMINNFLENERIETVVSRYDFSISFDIIFGYKSLNCIIKIYRYNISNRNNKKFVVEFQRLHGDRTIFLDLYIKIRNIFYPINNTEEENDF